MQLFDDRGISIGPPADTTNGIAGYLHARQLCPQPGQSALLLMAVTKRVRFEILRRDNHACQYCGLVAPDTQLTIDHVIPVALGGGDKPDNLVAACKDCNAGKTSIGPDSPIVAAVAARSAEFALTQANLAAHIRADFAAISDYCEGFIDTWNVWGNGEGKRRETVPIPDDWRRTVTAWWKMSVPLELLQEAVPTAMTAKGKNQAGVPLADKWRYFCGIIWRTLEEYEATYPAGANAGRVYSGEEFNEYGADAWVEGWHKGADNGYMKGAREMREDPDKATAEYDRLRAKYQQIARQNAEAK